MENQKIIEYYNKFNENKRLASRHGQVEFFVTNKYITKYLKNFKNPQILDVGAGTGRYAINLLKEGYNVTSVELVPHNIQVFKSIMPNAKVYQGNALDLSLFHDKSFDIVLLLGPLYHLFSFDDKLKALTEAKRVVKTGGIIFAAYCLNDYSVITYGFKENHIVESFNSDKLTKDFITKTCEDDLYSYDTIKNINKLQKASGLKRLKTISPDGPTDYIRQVVNKMDEKTFNIYMQYVLTICERKELLGAGSHIVDILKKDD